MLPLLTHSKLNIAYMHLAVSEKSQRGRKKKQIKDADCDGRNLKTITVLTLSFVKGTSKCIPMRKGDFHGGFPSSSISAMIR
ncbi:MAG: hypothetical protein N2V78_11720 [Methanophagales archaeon]|nr:hypothetical protein [Methanophagales archaeon]